MDLKLELILAKQVDEHIAKFRPVFGVQEHIDIANDLTELNKLKNKIKNGKLTDVQKEGLRATLSLKRRHLLFKLKKNAQEI